MARVLEIARLSVGRCLAAAALLALHLSAPSSPALADGDRCAHCPELQFRDYVEVETSPGRTSNVENVTITIRFSINNTSFGERLDLLGDYLFDELLITLGIDPEDYDWWRADQQRVELLIQQGKLDPSAKWQWLTRQYYVPVAGYEKLRPDTVASFMYFMFRRPLQDMAEADAKARALAEQGIRTCDKNLLMQAIADLKVVLGVYKARLTHVHDIKEMNEHQLAYYASELDYLFNPTKDIRFLYGWIPIPGRQNVGAPLDAYLGIDVSRVGINGGTFDFEPILDEIDERRTAIATLGAKSQALIPFFQTNIAVVSTNIARLKAIADGM